MHVPDQSIVVSEKNLQLKEKEVVFFFLNKEQTAL